MPDADGNYTDEELGLNTDVVEQLDPNLRDEIRKSRSRLKDSQKWQARAEQAERQIAVRDVGIDTGSKLGQMFIKSYEGDWTPEALKAEAEQIPGLLPVSKGDEGNQQSQEELDALRRMQGAGATTGQGGQDAREKLEGDLRSATSQADVLRLLDQADPALGVYRKGLS
jgi:hypothetical protein